MNRMPFPIVALACLLVLSNPAAGSEALPPRSITVTGTAHVKVVPDQVALRLQVSSLDQDIHKAKEDNDRRVKSVLALAGEFQIDPKHVQTDRLELNAEWRNEKFVGYRVQNDITVVLHDLAKFEDFLTRALVAGEAWVRSIEFRTTEERRHRDNARLLAIRAAKEKATAMAGALGQAIGWPLTIEEGSTGWGHWAANRQVEFDAGGGAAEQSMIAPGQIVISAQVTIAFELE